MLFVDVGRLRGSRVLLSLVVFLFLSGFLRAESEAKETSAPQGTQDDSASSTPSGGPTFEAEGHIGLSAVFVDINGSEGKYRSDYNTLSGFALDQFSLSLTNQQPGLGWMDFLTLDGSGFGDAFPSEDASLTVGKRGLYDFRGRYWKQNYFFDLPSYALGNHGADSARRSFDLNLRIYASRNFTLEFGYYQNHRYGTSYTTLESFTNLYELLDPRRGTTRDMRLALYFDSGGLHLSAAQHFRYFKEDPDQESNRLIGAGTLPDTSISAPVRQKAPSTRFTARYAPSDQWMLEGKYHYSDGHVDAERNSKTLLELSQGIGLEELIYATSISDRPEHWAEGTAMVGLGNRLIFTNIFGYHSFELTGSLSGETTWRGTSPGSGSQTIHFEDSQALDYQRIQNQAQLEFFLHPELSFYGGYRYSDRDVEKPEDVGSHGTVMHTGLGGVSWKPYRGARVSAEFERGSSDNAFTNTEPRELTRWRISARLPLIEGLTVTPHFLLSNHENRTPDNAFDSDQRQLGVEVSYMSPDQPLLLTGGYNLLYLDSEADIRYFLSRVPVEGISNYRTKLHFAHILAEVPLKPWASLQFGYNLLRDPEDSSFPLKRDIGTAGVVFRTGERWTWDVNYRHVSYNETNYDLQDYSANQLALTLGWSF